MEISVTHVKQKDLPDYVFPDGLRPAADLPQNAPVEQPPTAALAASASVAGVEQAAQEANANLAEAMQEEVSTSGDSKRRRVEKCGMEGSRQEAVPDSQTRENGAEHSGERHPGSGEKRRRVGYMHLPYCLLPLY